LSTSSSTPTRSTSHPRIFLPLAQSEPADHHSRRSISRTMTRRLLNLGIDLLSRLPRHFPTTLTGKPFSTRRPRDASSRTGAGRTWHDFASRSTSSLRSPSFFPCLLCLVFFLCNLPQRPRCLVV